MDSFDQGWQGIPTLTIGSASVEVEEREGHVYVHSLKGHGDSQDMAKLISKLKGFADKRDMYFSISETDRTTGILTKHGATKQMELWKLEAQHGR